MRKKIFVALSTFGKHGETPIKLLKEKKISYQLNPFGRRPTQEEIIHYGNTCEGIIAGVELYNDKVLESLPSLRCISRCGTGIDNISLKKAKEKSIVIFNTPHVVIQPVAELTIAMIFDLLRKLSVHTLFLKSKRWEKKTGHLLTSQHIGILGLGKIGKRVAEILRKLDASVYGADLDPDTGWAKKQKIEVVSVDELLKNSDIVSIHISHSDEHPFYLDKNQIKKMKRGAMLVNVSRGQFVDELALHNALQSGHLSGAALDVFQTEPYSGILCELENVILTPHIGTLTQESRLQMEIEATQNLINFFTNQFI